MRARKASYEGPEKRSLDSSSSAIARAILSISSRFCIVTLPDLFSLIWENSL
jgi:hypothetical protein